MILFLIFILFSFLLFIFFYKFVSFVNETTQLFNLYVEKDRNKTINIIAWQNVSLKASRNVLFLLRKQEKILYELQKRGIYVKTERTKTN